jgi:outer membrane protein insertion porin family
MFDGSQPSSLDQIADSLKAQTYTSSVEGITSELEERVRRALQERGFFKPQVSGNTRVLSSSPIETRVAVAFHVDEGKEYHLAGIKIRNNHAVSDANALRDLIPVKEGELFNRTHLEEGLEKLKNAYWQQGYINFTVVPETKINEDDNSVWLDLDLDEGKVFVVSKIDILGVDEQAEHQMLQDFLLKPGDIYSQTLFDISIQRLSPTSSIPFTEKRMNEQAGTVALTIGFGRCPE